MEPEVRAAVERSFLAQLPADALERLLAGAVLEPVSAGTTTYRAGGEPRPSLIVSGLFRSYFAGPDGRQVTVRYAREGDVLGVVAAAGGPAPLYVQALTDSQRLLLDIDTLRALASNDAQVAWVLIGALTATVHALWHELAATAFATVPQRVARHLLEISAREQEANPTASTVDGALVAHVSQQELADLVGSVREVVARALRELRDEGIVRVNRTGIVVLEPTLLAARAWPVT
jgi:CRP/FNR family transcriptional regulator, cyclic AMP receptor protein